MNSNKQKHGKAAGRGHRRQRRGDDGRAGDEHSPATDRCRENVAVGQMTMAATTTASGKDDTVEATSMAVPVIKGPAKLPAEEQAAE